MKTAKHNKNKDNTFNNLIHNTMKKRTIIATIAVALIAGVSIFAACTKEDSKENKIIATEKINESELQDVTVGYMYMGTTNIYPTLNVDEYLLRLEEILNDSCSWTTDQFIAEDVQMWMDTIDPITNDYRPVMKVSFYDVTIEEGITVYIEPRLVAAGTNTDIFNLVVGLDEIHSVCTGICHHPRGCYYTRDAATGQIMTCYCPKQHWDGDYCHVHVYQNLFKVAVLWGMQ